MQASTATIVDAGLVRLAELGARLLYLRQNYQPTDQVVQSIIDLRQKLEALGTTKLVSEQNILKQYVQETYGLGAVYTDPLLRPLLPTIPAAGAQIRPVVLRIQGNRILRIQGGKALGVRNRLAELDYGENTTESDETGPVPSAPLPLVPAAPAVALPRILAFTKQTVVNVEHGLGRPVSVLVFNTNGDEIDGSISSTLNSVTVSFSEAVSGTLYIS